MIYADLIHSNKFAPFLGVSLVVHVAVLGNWPVPSSEYHGATSRAIQLVLSPSAENEAAVQPAPPVPQIREPLANLAPELSDHESMSPLVRLVAIQTSGPSDTLRAPEIRKTKQATRTTVKRARKTVKHVDKTVKRVVKKSPPAPIPVVRSISVAKATETKPVRTAHLSRASTDIKPTVSKAAAQKTFTAKATFGMPATSTAAIKEPMAVDLSRLTALLHEQILQHRRYPSLAKRQRREGVATVSFQLYPNGQLQAVSLGHSSGFKALDSAALTAVNRVSPFTKAGEFLTQAREFSVNVVFKLR